MPVDPKQLEQWKDLAKDATAGPWRAQGNFGGAATLHKEQLLDLADERRHGTASGGDECGIPGFEQTFTRHE